MYKKTIKERLEDIYFNFFFFDACLGKKYAINIIWLGCCQIAWWYHDPLSDIMFSWNWNVD